MNAVTRHDPPLAEVEILNPYSAEEFVGDDLRIVDVRARDASGAQLQLEVQLVVRRWLGSRMLYTWADLYQGQLQRGEHFRELRPVISIWVLAENLLGDPRWHHRFQLWDVDAGLRLTDHLDLHTLELRKWRAQPEPPDEGALAGLDAWAYFLREAGQWTELPARLCGPEMEKAMSVLNRFAQKGEDYYRYQARMNYLREQAAIADERAELLSDLHDARSELEARNSQLEAINSEIESKNNQLEAVHSELDHKSKVIAEQQAALERLRARLAALGEDPPG